MFSNCIGVGIIAAANIIINNAQPVSAILSVCHFMVSWPTVSLMKIAVQWPCTSCHIFPPFTLVCSLWGATYDKPGQQFSLTSLLSLPQWPDKSYFCVPGQQKYFGFQSNKWTSLSGYQTLAQHIICYWGKKKKKNFFLWIKTCKIVLNHILSDAFLYVIFFVNIFLVSSTACKGFISLKKGEED